MFYRKSECVWNKPFSRISWLSVYVCHSFHATAIAFCNVIIRQKRRHYYCDKMFIVLRLSGTNTSRRLYTYLFSNVKCQPFQTHSRAHCIHFTVRIHIRIHILTPSENKCVADTRTEKRVAEMHMAVKGKHKASQQKEPKKICIMVIMKQCELHANMHIVIVVVIIIATTSALTHSLDALLAVRW